jgi:ribosome maturation factor RimP
MRRARAWICPKTVTDDCVWSGRSAIILAVLETGLSSWEKKWAFRPFFICIAGLVTGMASLYMQLAEIIEQAVVGLGYELVEFETSPRARLLRVFIDSSKGIGIDDCSAVSNHLTRLFAVENVDYDRLEVSSPGLDRPLKKAADFERFAGQEVQLRSRIAVGNQRNFSGVLVGLVDGEICLKTETGERRFALAQVDKARLVPKL